MKLFIKFLILLLTLAIAVPFFMNGSDGQPLMNLSQIKLPDMSVPTIDTLKRNLPFTQENHKGAIQVYKWKDEKGVVHYSDHQVAKQPSKLTLIKGITILPSTSNPNTVNHEIDASPTSSNKGMTLPSLTTIPLADIPKLIQDAKQVEQLLHERKLNQDSIIESAH